MDCEASMDLLLECMLLDPSAEPTDLPLSLLKTVTNDFSDNEMIGSGGFATVYKGKLPNGTFIAVKKLFHNLDMDDEKFIKEVGCLMKAKHKNIVRFLGYCSDAPGKILNHEGRMILAEEPERLLCFEFLLKGSLDKYISDVSVGLEWKTRYKIIKGICEGLHYLHQDIHIVHSDLKPANILLDENMVPKIADYGLARCFDGKQSQTITSKVMGTLGYLAPESYDGVITFKSDIYSLGIIIIEILTGRKGYCDIRNVLENWTNRFKTSHGVTWLEHVRVCAEISLDCRDLDPRNRPTIVDVIDRLAELEHKYGFIETDVSTTQVLDVYPQDIWFPFQPNEIIKCPVTLTNNTGIRFGVCIQPTNLDACSNPGYPYVWEPEYEDDEVSSSCFIRLGPHSSETIYMTMRKQDQSLVQDDKGMFDVVMIATKSEEDLQHLANHWEYFTRRRARDKSVNPLIGAKEFGTVVHVAALMAAVTRDPSRCQEFEVPVHQERVFEVSSLQVSSLQESNAIDSIKFIAGEQRFVARDNKGVPNEPSKLPARRGIKKDEKLSKRGIPKDEKLSIVGTNNRDPAFHGEYPLDHDSAVSELISHVLSHQNRTS